MKKLIAIVEIIEKTNTLIGIAVGFLVIPIMVILLYGVVMRYIFNQPIFWGGQVSLTLYIALGVLAGAYVFHKDFHVRVDILAHENRAAFSETVRCRRSEGETGEFIDNRDAEFLRLLFEKGPRTSGTGVIHGEIDNDTVLN